MAPSKRPRREDGPDQGIGPTAHFLLLLFLILLRSGIRGRLRSSLETILASGPRLSGVWPGVGITGARIRKDRRLRCEHRLG